MALDDSGSVDSDSLRNSQALLLISVMISLYHSNGRMIYANPAARSMLGAGQSKLSARLVDQKNYSELINAAELNGECRAECLVNTNSGQAWHELTVQYGPDAVTGGNAYLISETNIGERLAAQQQAKKLAFSDALTGLANRSNLVDQPNRELRHARRYKKTVAVLFLDLDRFKSINDSLGHDVGDELLVGVADSIVNAVYETDTVARLGGDEFICILRDLSSPSSAAKTASRVRQQISLPKVVGDRELFGTASIGVSVYPMDGDSSESLLKHADIAMYQAKAEGGNTAIYFDMEMNKVSEARMSLEAELRKAQKAGEFEVYYQPRVDVASEKITGVEALLRWNHPQRGLLDAFEFVNVADESGMLSEIDSWVLQVATRQQVSWKRQGIFLKVSINVFARRFKSQSLLSDINQALEQRGCRAQDLELEITESVYMGSEQSVLKLLDSLRQTGLSLAVDDFGTGYSNLAYLKNFPIDCLKIDQMFVRDNANHALLEWIVSLGKLLGVKLVAEGVETIEQFNLLKTLGCNGIQGYYFSPAVDADSISRLVSG